MFVSWRLNPMCGRYNFTVEQSDEIQRILEKLNARYQGREIPAGEVFPTNLTPVLVEGKKEIIPVLGTWGFPKFDGKGVIINARTETAYEKRTFRDSLLYRRCIIPSTGFYEWNSEKRKFLFHLPEINTLYMAGAYNLIGGELRYVILTTDSNDSIQDVHKRMPLIILQNEIETWIKDSNAASKMLKQVPPELIRVAV